MSVQVNESNTRQPQAAAVQLSVLGDDIRDPALQEASVGLLEGSKADSSRLVALLGAGPEIPGAPAGRLGGRSYTELMVEVQKALAQMSFDTKIVNREQSVAFGKAKAQTIDDGADKIRSGAIAAYVGAVVGAVINTGMNVAALKYSSRSAKQNKVDSLEIEPPKSQNNGLAKVDVSSKSGLGDQGVQPNAGGNAAAGAGGARTPDGGNAGPSGTGDGSGPSGGAGGGSGPAAQASGQSRQKQGSQPQEISDGGAPDGQYVSPMMQIYSQFGSAGSTVASGTGDIIDKHMQADKMELDADGQLFDTYSGEQSQFYSDANQNVQRAMGLIGSFVGQIYNTNTSIIASMPR